MNNKEDLKEKVCIKEGENEKQLKDLLKNLYQTSEVIDVSLKTLPKTEDELKETEIRENTILNSLESQSLINKSIEKTLDNEIAEPKIQTVFTIEEQLKHKAIIDAGLFIAGSIGLSVFDLRRMLGDWNVNSDYIAELIKQINETKINQSDSGILIQKFGDQYKTVTKADLAKHLNKVVKVKLKSALTPAVLETLAIICYNNPCSKAMIEKIRNVDATNNLEKLIQLELIYKSDRFETPGRPWAYRLTNKFYDIFGIKNLQQLPKIPKNEAKIIDSLDHADHFDDNDDSDELFNWDNTDV